MGTIRAETETDRSERTLAALDLTLPLRRGVVEIEASERALESPAGQKLLVLLVNVLARMKGIVSAIHLPGVADQKVHPAVPLFGGVLATGIDRLVRSLNSPQSEYEACVEFAPADESTVRIAIGNVSGDAISVGADAWRSFLGRCVAESDWETDSPFGPSMAASIAAAEAFKRLVEANTGPDPRRVLLRDLRFSTFNYGLNGEAEVGPARFDLFLRDVAIVGCGAGGTAALYVLAMSPRFSGEIALVEPSLHKPSNLNRYLMASASDVNEPRHKLASVVEHLARLAPTLTPTLYPVAWEQLASPLWPKLISTVDTVESRWMIQRRAVEAAEIYDAAVLGLLYTLLRVVPGGWCLECKHPLDPVLPQKQRAARWGVSLPTLQKWEAKDVRVTREMITRLAEVQGTTVDHYGELEGIRFREVPQLTECGETPLRTDVPSQAPVLPLATTAAGVALAAEVAKAFVAPEAQLSNWMAHDLAVAPKARLLNRFRPAREDCPCHTRPG